MAYILNIETATKNCSVAISHNGKLVSVAEKAEQGYTHAENLHVFIRQVINETGISMNDIAAVAVSKGPGSYTGLRIGVSAAKGLCYALDIPVIVTDTLKILATQLKTDNGFIVPMLDARRMEVYTAVYDASFEVISPVSARIITPDSFSEYTETLHFLGDGAEKCRDVITNPKAVFHTDILYPSAKEMCQISYLQYENKDFADVAYFEPYYLKEFAAGK